MGFLRSPIFRMATHTHARIQKIIALGKLNSILGLALFLFFPIDCIWELENQTKQKNAEDHKEWKRSVRVRGANLMNAVS